MLLKHRLNISSRASELCCVECPFKWTADTGGGKGGKRRGSDGTKARKRGEEKPAGTWSARRKARKTFIKEVHKTDTETHLYTRTEQKHCGQNYSKHTGKCKTETFRREQHSSFVTECNEAAEHFDCGTVESQENPSGARVEECTETRSQSERRGKKCPYINECLQGRISELTVYTRMSARVYVCVCVFVTQDNMLWAVITKYNSIS